MNYIKKNIKKILGYIITFVLTVFILFSALAISAKIPLSSIKDNLIESAEYYNKKSAVYATKRGKYYSYVHISADAKKLEMIYCIDTDNPIESIMWSKYYRGKHEITNKSLYKLVKNSEKPNRQYLRYWNGSMLFLRPLLILFNIEQIYLINAILLFVLLFSLFIMLLKISQKAAFIYLFSLILVAVGYVLSIEYSVTFYIMAITSMIALKIDQNKKKKSQEEVDEKLSKLFLITGIVTTFFDFLTTELITIFVPIILILIIRNEKNRLGSLKDTFRLVLKFSILWFIGYCGMWIAKWVLSAIILNVNAFKYVAESAMERINGLSDFETNSYTYLYGQVILKNIFVLPVIDFINVNINNIIVMIFLILIFLVLLKLIKWDNLKNKKILLIFLLIGLMPYIRYLILANHSAVHFYFTFRAQIITIMCLMYVISECLDYELIKNINLNTKKRKKKKN